MMSKSLIVKLTLLSQSRNQDYFRWFNNLKVREYLDINTPKSMIEINSWLGKIKNSDRNLYYSIFLKNEKKYVGHVGFKNINYKNKSAEIGIIIGEPSYWRKGIGIKAVQLILKKIRKIGLSTIIARISKYNIGSINLFKKLGFSNEIKKDKNFVCLVLAV